MPTKLPAKEEKLLRFYIQEGATEDKIPVVAKRFRQKETAVRKVLNLKRVREECERRMLPIRLEQEKQRMVAEVVEQTTAKLAAEKAELEAKLAAATQMPPLDVTGNEVVIGQELMRLVRLDPEKYGGVKLAAIKTAYVVAGIMEQGTTRRTVPPDNPNTGGSQGIYTSHFDRMRLEQGTMPVAPAAPEPTAAPDDGVYELIPSDHPVPPLPPQEIKLPPPGESIEPVKRRNQADSRVLTIEV